MYTHEQACFGLSIDQKTYDRLIHICKETLPNEACGLLVRSAGSESIDSVVSIRNVHPSPQDSFAFDPEEWTIAFFSMQKNRQQIVGFFHSHPNSAALPSLKDKDGWLPQSGLDYWIVSMTDERSPLVQPYIAKQGDFVPVPLVLA